MSDLERQAADLGKQVAAIHLRNRRYGNTEGTAFYYAALQRIIAVCPTARTAFDAAYRTTTQELEPTR